MSAMKTDEEFIEALEQMAYEAAFPWERYFMNRLRRAEGKPPLRVEPIGR